ncbi:MULTISPECIES: zinc-binding dehydrogenase [Streptomyces]|uniref:Zinc-binding dehydrogenase n=1 Tax=Streptomyces koelreuteriae TaxID=2838015 RepID=A0ABX8G1U1_9ACTN|nr:MULTISPECIES: zinc-binding dehydrogenase [Streptomyces]QWB27331.1 zinc-binding dehydrogenase [Streptomyces koelreuteriae]UUA10415.1 zinc-binding dehydrogenase [Streptomyces koelreuteriae]UUA18022.1 zinc-binding dehydrogenase [Streptomyces sp. CRCS-T-1]
MHALVLDRPGTCDTLRPADLPTPEPGPGQVRVEVEACGLNPSDYQRAAYGIPEWEWPAVLGLDVVGVVDAVGEHVTHVRPGQRVAYHGDIRERGGFAEYSLADATVLAPVPDGLAPAAAAALPSAGPTAYQAVIRRLGVGKGDTVLITGGAGGVGGFAVQLAALAGARVFATEAAHNAEHVEALGAEAVIDFRTEDIPTRVRELTDGRGLDAVVDTIGTDSATANLRLLAHGGGLAAIAGRPDLSAVPPFGMAPSVHEIALGAAYTVGDERSRAQLSGMLTDLLALTAEGRLDPMLARRVRLDEVPAALVELSGRGVRGKLVYVRD